MKKAAKDAKKSKTAAGDEATGKEEGRARKEDARSDDKAKLESDEDKAGSGRRSSKETHRTAQERPTRSALT